MNWESAANELDLDPLVRYKAREKSTMRGEINGHRVTVSGYHRGQPEIDVRFESGLRSLDIDRRSDGQQARPTDLLTGDPAFDELYVIESQRDSESEVLLDWLNSERREVLVVLADALNVREIEEGELEVKLGREEWTPNEMVQAVNLCVLAASVLDRSHKSHSVKDAPPIQDAVIQDAVIQDAVIQDAVIEGPAIEGAATGEAADDDGPQDQVR